MLGGPEKAQALKSAKRASERSAALVHGELKRGLNSLATIASTAPWVGLFGTILGIHNSFGGVNGSKTSIMAYYFDGLSRAFVPCAIGLIVALVAMWCYKYLLTEVEAFDSEMESASLQLINDLGRLGLD
jgi:biopolymer transport protein ExbB/biopolymer transport protein TolQ